MNKKTLSILAGTSLAIVTGSLFVNQVTPKIVSSINAETCNHEGNHYQQLDPTFTTAGHRQYWVCCKCHETFLTNPGGNFTDQSDNQMTEGGVEVTNPAYLPVLNTTDYTKSAFLSTSTDSRGTGILIEEWSLKNSDYVYKYDNDTRHGGYVRIYKNGSELGYYYPEEFNIMFDGVNMSFDKTNWVTTLNVTKSGGYVFDGYEFNFGSALETTLKITGEPLTFCTDHSRDCLVVNCNAASTSGTVFGVVDIYNKTSIMFTGASSSTIGINTGNLAVNVGASLTIKNFKTGVRINYSKVNNLKGTLNISSTDKAIISNNSNARSFSVGTNKVYSNHTLLSGTYSTSTVTGKHVVIIPTTIDDVISVSAEVDLAPTTEKEGTAKILCSDCRDPIGNIVLPTLNSGEYDVESVIEVEGGIPYATTNYTFVDDTYGELTFSSKAELKNYIQIANTYLNPAIWNKTYPNAIATESGEENARVLTITLNGTEDVDLNSYFDGDPGRANGLKLNTYSKVKITGNGTLNLNNTGEYASACLAVRDFELDTDSVLNISSVKTGTTTQQSYYYGLMVSGTTTIRGELNITKFSAGLFIASGVTNGVSVEITSSGKVIMNNVSTGVYNSSALNFVNEGHLEIVTSGTGSNYYGFNCNNNAVYRFSGDSDTNVSNAGYGFRGNSKKLEIYIQGNAEFTLSTTFQGITDFTKLIIANSDDGTTRSSAKVTISNNAKGYCALYIKQVGTDPSLTVFNSSQPIVIQRPNDTANCAISVNGGDNVIKFLSNVNFNNYTALFTFTNNPTFAVGAFVTEDNKNNPTITVNRTTADYASGTTVPANLPDTITKNEI